MYTYLKFGLPRVLPPGKIKTKVHDQCHPQIQIFSTNCLLSLIVYQACSLMTSKNLSSTKSDQITSGKEEGLENSSGYDSTDEEVIVVLFHHDHFYACDDYDDFSPCDDYDELMITVTQVEEE